MVTLVWGGGEGVLGEGSPPLVFNYSKEALPQPHLSKLCLVQATRGVGNAFGTHCMALFVPSIWLPRRRPQGHQATDYRPQSPWAIAPQPALKACKVGQVVVKRWPRKQARDSSICLGVGHPRRSLRAPACAPISHAPARPDVMMDHSTQLDSGWRVIDGFLTFGVES